MSLTSPVHIFYVYSSDEHVESKKLLDSHLHSRNYPDWVHWDRRRIIPGEEWDKEIKIHLNEADIILLLISSNFMASDACYEEMNIALDRHEKGEAHVIPIIFRPVNWDNAPFKHLQVLPADSRPITDWPNQDTACANVHKGISKVIDDIKIKREVTQLIEEADSFFKQKQYQQALQKYKEAEFSRGRLSNEHPFDFLLLRIADTQQALGQWEDALDAYERYEEAVGGIVAIADQSIVTKIHANKGKILFRMDNFSRALPEISAALERESENADLWRYRGLICAEAGDLEGAKDSFVKATTIKPEDAFLHKAYGDLLLQFNCLEEAWLAYEQAIKLKPDFRLALEQSEKICRALSQQWLKRAEERARSLKNINGINR